MNKTLSERPDIAYLYHDALKIPEMKEYLKVRLFENINCSEPTRFRNWSLCLQP